MNLLMDVAACLSNMGANVLSVSTHTDPDSIVDMRFLIQVSDTAAITRIIDELQNVSGVFEARRMAPNEASAKRQKKKKGR